MLERPAALVSRAQPTGLVLARLARLARPEPFAPLEPLKPKESRAGQRAA